MFDAKSKGYQSLKFHSFMDALHASMQFHQWMANEKQNLNM